MKGSFPGVAAETCQSVSPAYRSPFGCRVFPIFTPSPHPTLALSQNEEFHPGLPRAGWNLLHSLRKPSLLPLFRRTGAPVVAGMAYSIQLALDACRTLPRPSLLFRSDGLGKCRNNKGLRVNPLCDDSMTAAC